MHLHVLKCLRYQIIWLQHSANCDQNIVLFCYLYGHLWYTGTFVNKINLLFIFTLRFVWHSVAYIVWECLFLTRWFQYSGIRSNCSCVVAFFKTSGTTKINDTQINTHDISLWSLQSCMLSNSLGYSPVLRVNVFTTNDRPTEAGCCTVPYSCIMHVSLVADMRLEGEGGGADPVVHQRERHGAGSGTVGRAVLWRTREGQLHRGWHVWHLLQNMCWPVSHRIFLLLSLFRDSKLCMWVPPSLIKYAVFRGCVGPFTVRKWSVRRMQISFYILRIHQIFYFEKCVRLIKKKTHLMYTVQ